MAFDAHKNFAYSTVAVAPQPSVSGPSLGVRAGDGDAFPTPPFNAVVWPHTMLPLATNAEIVRVTAISTDTLTIEREQEGTSARQIKTGDQIAAAITAKTLTDIEAAAVTGIADIPGLQAALDTLQASATAATDAELAAAVATLNTAIAGKQDAASAATDAELASAVATINAAAATDAELASAVATINTAIAARRRVVSGGNLGAAPSLAMLSSDEDVTLVGTLNANATLTITGLVASQSIRLLLTQDATGGRTLSIAVGASTAAVSVNTTAGATSVVNCFYDGTDLYVRGA